jgi:hypothetical protein
MDVVLARPSPSLIALFLAIGMAAGWIIGYWIGHREPTPALEPAESRLDDASLTLLALLLAFAFGTAMARHEQRRLMVIADANAIGDFYTCASLLNEPVRTQLQTEIREYTHLRLETAHQGLKPNDLNHALDRFQLMQQEMTVLVGQAVNTGTPIAVSLTNTLNGVTSAHGSRIAAAEDRLPIAIPLLLITSALTSAFLVGREAGKLRRMAIAGMVSFILIVTLAIYVTFDLDDPLNGLIYPGQQPIQRVFSSMNEK